MISEKLVDLNQEMIDQMEFFRDYPYFSAK